MLVVTAGVIIWFLMRSCAVETIGRRMRATDAISSSIVPCSVRKVDGSVLVRIRSTIEPTNAIKRHFDRRAQEARNQEHDEERPERLDEKPVEREKRVRRARDLGHRERVDALLEPGNNATEHLPIIRKAGRNREAETRLATVTGY